jgi:hypothetical protein
VRAHLFKHAKENIAEWYDLDAYEKGEPRAKRIAYLLENDRFTCAVEAYEAGTHTYAPRCKANSGQDCGRRFLAPQIPRYVHTYYFNKTRSTVGWSKDSKTYIRAISIEFFGALCTMLFWALKQAEDKNQGGDGASPFVPDTVKCKE